MPKFFIEVPHDPDELACAEVVRVFLTSGSHFLANAEWGCLDGDHTARIIVEMETKQDARSIVPPVFRPRAKVVALNRFTLQQVDIVSRHAPARRSAIAEPAASTSL